MPVYIGLDIGGTKLMAAAADESGAFMRKSPAVPSTSLNEDLAALDQLVSRLAGSETILGLGAAVGGPLDWRSGVVSPLHQPTWRQVPLKAILQERWGCPVSLDVDTNVAAVGEYHHGGEQARRFLYLTLSTGMGGGFLIDGRVYRGRNEAHPEVAHQAVPLRLSAGTSITCECGLPDCLEGLVSGNAIRRIYGKPAEKLEPHEWQEVAWHLGQGMRNLTAILAPDLIVLGGGVALGGGSEFVEHSAQVMRGHLRLVPPPEVRLSRLGYDTALLGALHIAQHGIA